MKSANALVLILVVILAGFALPVNAQSTGASHIVGINPNDTTQCPTSGYRNVSGTFNTSTISDGYCAIQVTWDTTMPSSLYAISCTPETSPSLGYLYNPQVSGYSRTPTGFTLYVSFHVNNIEISNDGNVPPGAQSLGKIVPSSSEEWYVFGAPIGDARRSPIALSELGVMYVDCVANSQ